MKIFQSSIFRALCAIVVGALLIKYPQDGVTWLTIAIGVLFLLSGIIAVMAYLNAKKHEGEYTITDSQGRIVSGGQPTFPIVGVGSVILGLVLALSPHVFVNGLMYILGAIMILGGINQLMNLVSARRLGKVSFGFWIAPSIIFITGLFVVLKPMETAELPLLILGWCSLLYGITELINALKIRSIRKLAERQQEESERLNQQDTAVEISSEINKSQEESTPTSEEKEEEYPDFIG
jgi:uncharacterized membrane protein HdeD (DUF308 family)